MDENYFEINLRDDQVQVLNGILSSILLPKHPHKLPSQDQTNSNILRQNTGFTTAAKQRRNGMENVHPNKPQGGKNSIEDTSIR